MKVFNLSIAENMTIPRHFFELDRAVREQARSEDSIASLLPVGLGEHGDDYNKLFMLTFSDIVLGGRDIISVLDVTAGKLQAILNETNARLWQPDTSSERPGKIE